MTIQAKIVLVMPIVFQVSVVVTLNVLMIVHAMIMVVVRIVKIVVEHVAECTMVMIHV